MEYYVDDAVSVYAGDCLEVLKAFPDRSFDAVVTDPPYGLEFMGKEWDSFTPADFQDWCEGWAVECLRVLKPGGHMLAFGGSRTFHRLACAVEDAGFEVRDTISWLYGQGFPKSMDVSKAIDKQLGVEHLREFKSKNPADRPYTHEAGETSTGWESPPRPDKTHPHSDEAKRWEGWGTALKPAWEPVVVARKPPAGTVAANVLAHGTGAINVDGCRVPTDDRLGGGSTLPDRGQQMSGGWRRPWMDDPEAVAANAARARESVARSEELGRWPANVLLDEPAAEELDRQSGWQRTGRAVSGRGFRTEYVGGESRGTDWSATQEFPYEAGGGASRYFPVFKYQAKPATAERPEHEGVAHPTVKPLELMRWLVRLVTPPGGVVLDPFAGSGTTGEAAILEHRRAVLVEREEDYLPLIRARLTKPLEPGLW